MNQWKRNLEQLFMPFYIFYRSQMISRGKVIFFYEDKRIRPKLNLTQELAAGSVGDYIQIIIPKPDEITRDQNRLDSNHEESTQLMILNHQPSQPAQKTGKYSLIPASPEHQDNEEVAWSRTKIGIIDGAI